MAAAAKRHLTGDPSAAIDTHGPAGRVERARRGRYPAGIKFSNTLGRQPRRKGGDRLVHHQVPRGGGIYTGNRLPCLNALDGKLGAAMGFRGEHAKETRIVHRLIDRGGKVPIGLGGRSMFGDQG